MNSNSGKNKTYQSCEFDENLDILRKINFFSRLPLEVLKVVAYLCTREKYQKGDYLFHQNEDDGLAFYIITGKASLFHNDKDGEHLIRNFHDGEFVGGLTLLGSLHRLFSLQSTTDLSCLILTRDKFAKVLEQFPDLMPKVLKVVIDIIRAWEERFLGDYSMRCDACMHNIGVSL
ncbi:MAG: cyclic nucleotide-binding domain-containing protein, partial [Desulfobacterales bacterium]